MSEAILHGYQIILLPRAIGAHEVVITTPERASQRYNERDLERRIGQLERELEVVKLAQRMLSEAPAVVAPVASALAGNVWEWTSTRPTKPGWYLGWMHMLFEPSLTNIEQDPDGNLTLHGTLFQLTARGITHWLGPLPESLPLGTSAEVDAHVVAWGQTRAAKDGIPPRG